MKKFADRFFRWYCDPDYYPDIKGDLEELYNRNRENSLRSANLKYLIQVLGLFRPSLIRSFNQSTIINPGMFRNYLKIGTRNLAARSYTKASWFCFVRLTFIPETGIPAWLPSIPTRMPAWVPAEPLGTII